MKVSLNSAAKKFAVMCSLALFSSAGFAQSYWFESYERAVAMIERGDTVGGEAILRPLVKDHPVPMAALRVQGDRFIDYRPYIFMARVEIARGDLVAAARNLDASKAFDEVAGRRRYAIELLRVRRELETLELRSAAGVDPAPATASAEYP